MHAPVGPPEEGPPANAAAGSAASAADRRRQLRQRSVPRAAGRADAWHLAPVFHGIGMVESVGDYHFAPHRHDAYEVIVVERGLYRCTVNGKEFLLRPDEGIAVKPGDVHEDFCRPRLAYFAVSFHLDSDLPGHVSAPALFAESVPAELQRFRTDRKVVQPLIRRIRWEAEHPDALSAHVQDALLAQFFWHLVRALPPDAVSEAFLDLSSRKAFPTQLMRVFRSNISRSLGLGEMARLMGISESSLSHKCKQMLGVSPGKAFLRCRLEWAKQLLRNTSMMVKEVAFSAGFQDPYAFSRAFTRHFGRAPSDSRLPSP